MYRKKVTVKTCHQNYQGVLKQSILGEEKKDFGPMAFLKPKHEDSTCTEVLNI